MCDQVESVRLWLHDFSVCVQSRDYQAAEKMFSSDASGFGTWTKKMTSLKELRMEQWEKVWPATKDFTFELDDISVLFSSEEVVSQCVVTASWNSTGMLDGREFPRSGCATIVLENQKNQHWRAIHTHFSQSPKGVL